MTARLALVVAVLVSLVACRADDGAGRSSPAPSTASVATTVPHTGPSDDLAPSQITASTVPPPDTPPPCEPAALSLWTAQVRFVDETAEAVIRVRNDTADRCEVDVFDSPLVDPAIEPDVWLHGGEWADLVVGADLRGGVDCATANVVTLALLDVNGEDVVVPTAAVVPCSWWLNAFYVVDPATGPCTADQLETVLEGDAVVVRNGSFVACELGALISVDGVGSEAPRSAAVPALTSLAPGDILAVPVSGSCDGPGGTLVFGAGASIEVAGLGPCHVVTLGPLEVFFDGTNGPLRDVDSADGALQRLDPFGDRA